MLEGSDWLAIYRRRGVAGIHLCSWKVTVPIMLAISTTVDSMDRSESVGIPRVPVPSRPMTLYCAPRPTRVPETMRRRVEIFWR